MVIFICGCTYQKNMSEHMKMEPISINWRDSLISVSVLIKLTGAFVEYINTEILKKCLVLD